MKDTCVVRLEGVSIDQDEHRVLSDVSFSVGKGEFVYLIGRVGSGKTSLIKVINAELELDGAECAEAVGYNLLKLKSRQVPQLRRKLGVIFQDFKLLNDRTVYNNLEFVLRATDWTNRQAIQKRIEEVLTVVGLNDKAHRMPHQLSGGEQQRVAIARALLNNPELILADEPTGNLDPETSDTIMRQLVNINRESGIALLIATHNHGLLKRFPARTLKCDKGYLTEVPNSEEIELDSWL